MRSRSSWAPETGSEVCVEDIVEDDIGMGNKSSKGQRN